MKFELNRLSEYSDASILDEIRRVADLTAPETLTIQTFEKHSRVKVGAIRRRFGTWGKALNAAGVGSRFSGQRGGSTPERLDNLSETEIMQQLSNIPKQSGSEYARVRDIDTYCDFSSTWLRRRLGISPRKALQNAGVPISTSGNRYTDLECFENLAQVWTHYGRPPKYSEMNQEPSIVGSKAYMKFGSWSKSLEAFIAFVERDKGVDESNSYQPSFSEGKSGKENRPGKNRSERTRNIKLGLRFEILHRDNFKCALCGNSPATDPTCRLHVDHIVPFSKGGETIGTNLRTLCERCNVGRGNRY
jgi:hypothetical protein